MSNPTDNAWAALDQALAGLPADTPLPIFIRDDDAGWDDAALLALLDTTAAAGVPIDLAAIPQAVGAGLAAELNRRHDAAPGLLGLHQHGLCHANHQPEGRKGEFGLARDADTQRADLRQGRDALQQHFGGRLDAVFTPPWNRCAPHTPALLAELGFAALSRDSTAPAQACLPELPVHLDWSRHHREGGAAAVLQALATALPRQAGAGPAFGLMLHHAVMDGAERALLARLLQRLRQHPGLNFLPMRRLLPAPAPAPAPALATADSSAPRAGPLNAPR